MSNLQDEFLNWYTEINREKVCTCCGAVITHVQLLGADDTGEFKYVCPNTKTVCDFLYTTQPTND